MAAPTVSNGHHVNIPLGWLTLVVVPLLFVAMVLGWECVRLSRDVNPAPTVTIHTRQCLGFQAMGRACNCRRAYLIPVPSNPQRGII